ncbi:unnamed protein product, partial [Amoebophrya sp. A25]
PPGSSAAATYHDSLVHVVAYARSRDSQPVPRQHPNHPNGMMSAAAASQWHMMGRGPYYNNSGAGRTGASSYNPRGGSSSQHMRSKDGASHSTGGGGSGSYYNSAPHSSARDYHRPASASMSSSAFHDYQNSQHLPPRPSRCHGGSSGPSLSSSPPVSASNSAGAFRRGTPSTSPQHDPSFLYYPERHPPNSSRASGPDYNVCSNYHSSPTSSPPISFYRDSPPTAASEPRDKVLRSHRSAQQHGASPISTHDSTNHRGHRAVPGKGLQSIRSTTTTTTITTTINTNFPPCMAMQQLPAGARSMKNTSSGGLVAPSGHSGPRPSGVLLHGHRPSRERGPRGHVSHSQSQIPLMVQQQHHASSCSRST